MRISRARTRRARPSPAALENTYIARSCVKSPHSREKESGVVTASKTADTERTRSRLCSSRCSKARRTRPTPEIPKKRVKSSSEGDAFHENASYHLRERESLVSLGSLSLSLFRKRVKARIRARARTTRVWRTVVVCAAAAVHSVRLARPRLPVAEDAAVASVQDLVHLRRRRLLCGPRALRDEGEDAFSSQNSD